MEPEQGKYGLWYAKGVGFATREQAEAHLKGLSTAPQKPTTQKSIQTKADDILGYPVEQWIAAGVVFVIGIVAWLYFSFVHVGSSDVLDEASRKDRMCNDSIMAWTMAQRFVRERLAAPSSAEFPGLPVATERVGECKFVVVSDVEAENAFGAKLRKRFSVTMTYSRQSDTWSGNDLNMP